MKCEVCGGLYEVESTKLYINVEAMATENTREIVKLGLCPDCVKEVKNALKKRAEKGKAAQLDGQQ